MVPDSGAPQPSDVPPLPRPPTDASWRDRADHWRERLVDVVEANRAGPAVAAVVVVLAALAAGAWLLWPERAGPPVEDSLPLLDPADVGAVGVQPEPAGSGPVDGPIVVHVAGAVASPGLVELPAGARVAEAVAAAGGPVAGADLDRINLAAQLADASRVYVPVEGETPPAADEAVGGVTAPTGPLDVNRATADELDELPGIGPATASAIIAHRDEHGPFTSVSGLEAVSGIGPAKLSRLRDLVTVAP